MVEILNNKKKYVFDPETMVVLQWEAAEREIIEARYYELMKSYADHLTDPKNMVPSFDETKEEDRNAYAQLTAGYQVAQMTPKEQWDEYMKKGYDYFSRVMKSVEHYQSMLRDFHKNLVMSGGRSRLVEGLLWDPAVPANDPKAVSKMRQTLRDEVVPSMTIKEMEDVISSFLHCKEFVEHLSLNYLRKQEASGQ